MATFTVTGDDTLVINDNVFNDLADEDTTVLTLPNELVNVTTGKNGNSIIAQNMKGFNGNLVVKLMRGSSDDQFLNAILQSSINNFVGTELAEGSFTKRIGDGNGNVVNDVYSLAGGVISKIPEAKENVSGDTAQATVMYNIKFTNCGRGIE